MLLGGQYYTWTVRKNIVAFIFRAGPWAIQLQAVFSFALPLQCRLWNRLMITVCASMQTSIEGFGSASQTLICAHGPLL